MSCFAPKEYKLLKKNNYPSFTYNRRVSRNMCVTCFKQVNACVMNGPMDRQKNDTSMRVCL